MEETAGQQWNPDRGKLRETRITGQGRAGPLSRRASFNHGTNLCQLPEDISNILKAPTAKNTNASGLGRAIINRRAKDARQTEVSGLVSCDRIFIAAPQSCLLVHDRHRSFLSFAVCHPRKGSRCFLEYGTTSRHGIYRR